MSSYRVRSIVSAVAAALVAALVVSGCAGTSGSGPPASTSPVEPMTTDLSGPRQAVESYLDWVTYAYRLGESDVASRTMSPEEAVRVDSYIQLNKEQGRVIDQRLVKFDSRPASVEATRALVGAREKWAYRYLKTDGSDAVSPQYVASYDTTYTVVEIEPGTWVVASVEVKALSEVK